MVSFRDPRQGNQAWRRASRTAPRQSLPDQILMNGRINQLIQQFPTLGEDPRQLFALASAQTSTEDMMEAAVSAVGTTGVQAMVQDFRHLPDEIQVARWASMPQQQRNAFSQLGYSVPELGGGGHGGFFSSVSIPMSGKLTAIADAVAFDSVLGVETPWSEWANSRENWSLPTPLAYTVGIVPQIAGMGVRGLMWTGEEGARLASRLYRTSQLYATAVDRSLGIDNPDMEMTHSFDSSAGWSPRSLWRAWGAAGYNGELLIRDEKLEEAADILGAHASAQDDTASDLWLAIQMAAGYSLEEIVEHRHGIDYQHPEFAARVEELYRHQGTKIEELTEAINVLELGKLSLGRDAARLIGADDWGTGDGVDLPLLGNLNAHTAISGGLDAAFVIYTDPLLIAGKGTAAARRAHAWQVAAGATQDLDRMADIARAQRAMGRVPMDELRAAYTDTRTARFLDRHRVLGQFRRASDMQNARVVNRQMDELARAMTIEDEIKVVEGLKATGQTQVSSLRVSRLPGYSGETLHVDDALDLLTGEMGRFLQDNRRVAQLWSQARGYHAAAKTGGTAIDSVEDGARVLRQGIDELSNPDAWWDFFRTIEGRKALFTTQAAGINAEIAMIPRINFAQQHIWMPTKRWTRARLDPAKYNPAHYDELADDLNEYLRRTSRGEEIAEGQFDELLNWREKADYGALSGRLDDAGYQRLGRVVKGLGAPARSSRRFVRSMAHYVPESKALEIGTDASIVELMKFAQMGALANLPQQYIDEVIGLLAVRNTALRAQIVKTVTADVLVRSGFLSKATKASDDVWKRFVLHLDQAYGISDGDHTMINGVESRTGLWTTPLAGTEFEDIIMIPNFRELAHATRHINMTRHMFLGFSHAPVIDTAMQKFWKPAQLLRIGFIPRAAGEEMIAFSLRRGFKEYFGARAALRAAGYRRLRTGEIVLSNSFHEATMLRPVGWSSHTMRKMLGMTDAGEQRRALDMLWGEQDFVKWSVDEIGEKLDEAIQAYRSEHRIRSWVRSADEAIFRASMTTGDFFHELGLAMHLPSKQRIAAMITERWMNEEARDAAEHVLTNAAYRKLEAEIAGHTFDPYRAMNGLVTRERHIPFREASTGLIRHIPMKTEISRYTAVARSDAADFAHNYSSLLRRINNDPTGEALMRAMADFIDPIGAARFTATLDDAIRYGNLEVAGGSATERFANLVRLFGDPDIVPGDVRRRLHEWALRNDDAFNRAEILGMIEHVDARHVIAEILENREKYHQADLQRLFSPHVTQRYVSTQDELVAKLTDMAEYELGRVMNQPTLRASIKANTNGRFEIIAPIADHETRLYFPMMHRNDLAGFDQLFQQGHVVDEFVDAVMVRLPGQFPDQYRAQLYEMIGQTFGDRNYFGQMVTAAGQNAVRGHDWVPIAGLASGNTDVAKVMSDVIAEMRTRYADQLGQVIDGSPVSYRKAARWSYADFGEDSVRNAVNGGFDISRPVGGTDFYRVAPHLTMEAHPILDEATLVQVRDLADGSMRWVDPSEIIRRPHRLAGAEQDLLASWGDEQFGPLADLIRSLYDDVDEPVKKGSARTRKIGILNDERFVDNQLRLYDEIDLLENDLLARVEDITLKIELHRGDPAAMKAAILNDEMASRIARTIGDEGEFDLLVTTMANDPDLIRAIVETSVFGAETNAMQRYRHLVDRMTQGTANLEEVQRITGSGSTMEVGTRMLARQMVDELMQSTSTFNNAGTPRNDVLFEVLDGALTNPDEYLDPVSLMARSRLDDLPQHVYGPRLMARNEMTWERIVRFGFDEVISPGIANLARTPHYSANAAIAMKQLRPLLDDMLSRPQKATVRHLARGDDHTMRLIDNALIQNFDEHTHRALREMAEQGLDTPTVPTNPALKLKHAVDHDDVEVLAEAIDDLGLARPLIDDPEHAEAAYRHVLDQLKGRQNALEDWHQAIAMRAYELTVPFIDDHRIRSQFQEFMSSLIPFWFAEEQFLRRWARGLYENPAALRKGQLLMSGFREVGLIRKDQYGNEVFVMPGSEAAMGILGPIIAGVYGGENVGNVLANPLTTRTEYMFPGLREDVGRPEFGPLVAVSLNQLANMFPEFSDGRDMILGDLNANRYGPNTGFVPETLDILLPSSLTRLGLAMMGDFDESALRSAELQAIAYLAANDLDPGPGASDAQIKEFHDNVRSIGRTILLVRAATGFTTGASYDTDIYGDDLQFSEEFRELLNAGVPMPDAIDALVERHGGRVTPYTVFASQSTSGAPIPSTQPAFDYMTANSDFIEAFPMAAPWFLPQERPRGEYGIAERRARNEAIAMGLRDLDTPEEFLREIYFAEAAEPYFERQERYREQRLALKSLPDSSEAIARLDAEWRAWSQSWQTLNPTFATDIQAGTGRVRREALISQMRDIVANPDVVPDVEHKDQLIELMQSTMRFVTEMDQLSGIQSGEATQFRRLHREYFYREALRLAERYPELAPFFNSVVRPLIGADQIAAIEFENPDLRVDLAG